MAMRINPNILLTRKRKFCDVKHEQNGKTAGADGEIASNREGNPVNASTDNRSVAPTSKSPQIALSHSDQTSEMSVTEDEENASQMNEGIAEKSVFKHPPSVEFSRNYNEAMTAHHSNYVFYTDKKQTLQADLQRYWNDFLKTKSESQVLQRIRKVPAFQLCDISVGIPNEEASKKITSPTTNLTSTSSLSYSLPPSAPPQRRGSHCFASMRQTLGSTASASTSNHHNTSQKFIVSKPTEFNCSAVSDSCSKSTKVRKSENNNHQACIAKSEQNKPKPTMFDLIYSLPKKESTTKGSKLKPSTGNTRVALTTVEQLEDVPVAIPVPQLKLNADGNFIIDEQSIEIEATADHEVRQTQVNSPDNLGMNYIRSKRTKGWPPKETIKFYRCLQTIGADFWTMSTLFPNRTRRDLKLKFKREERNNTALIDKAILYPKTFNLDELRDEFESEERELKEAEQKWKEIKKREPKSVKKVYTSKAARVHQNSSNVYENVVKPKMGQRGKSQVNTTGSSEKTQLSDAPTNKCSKNDKRSQVVTVSPASFIKLEKATPNKDTSLQLEQKHVNIKQVASQNIVKGSILVQKNNVNIVESSTKAIGLKANVFMDVSAADNENLVSANDTGVEGASNSSVNFNTTNTSQESDYSDKNNILRGLVAGSLAFVTTFDPNNEYEAVDAIYIRSKETGDIGDIPLDIPDAIVQSILSTRR